MEREQLRILLVDDEESFVKVLGLSLKEEYGYNTTVTLSGREATRFIETDPRGFDVILLDYMMPDFSGLNVLQWMHEQKCETPVIVLTGAGSEEVAVEAMKLGAYDYARKEQLELHHLDILIKSTHERHLFRIAKSLDEDRTKEILKNREATDKVQQVMSSIAPALNSALVNLSVAIDSVTSMENSLDRAKMKEELLRPVRILEAGLRGLLNLYQLLYAHHSEAGDIERLRKDLQEKIHSVSESEV